MAQVGLTLDFSGLTGYLIVVWKKATAPLTEVDRSAALPFPVAQVITAPDLSDETYIFEFWQSSDGTTLNTLLRSWSVDASAFSGASVTTYEYEVDRGNTNVTEGTGSEVWSDPVQDDTQIVDQRLAGAAKVDIQVSMRGTGLRASEEWDLISGGGIKLNLTDEVFNHGDKIFVTQYKKTSATPTVVVSDFSDVKIVSSDATVDNTFKNKLVYCNSTAAVCTLTFPAFSTMADQKMKIVTHAMTGNYLAIQFNGTNSINVGGANRNVVHLPRCKEIEILWKNNVAYVMLDNTGYDVLGNRILTDDVKPHQLLNDGTIRDTDDFPRFVEYIKSLPASLVLSNRASWNSATNKHKYYLNESLGEFSLPDDRDMHYRALSDFTAVPGIYTPDQLQNHEHESPIGLLPISVFGRGLTSRHKGNYDRQQDGITDLTGPPINADGSPLTSGSETSVKAVRQFSVTNI